MKTYLPPVTPIVKSVLYGFGARVNFLPRTVCTALKGKAERKAVGGKATVFAGICPSVKESLSKVSVLDSSAYSLKGLEPVILSGAGKICL